MKSKKKIDCDSAVNQGIKDKFVEREVVYCVSPLVYELAQKAEHFPDYYDELLEAFRGMPDYEEAATQAGWKEKKNKDGFVNKNEDEESDADSWQELCDEQGIDTDDFIPEIFEHWIVSDWLANKLKEHGHKVMRDFFGMTIWCRPTTGQAIMLDGVISEICEELEILDGQKNSWAEKKKKK